MNHDMFPDITPDDAMNMAAILTDPAEIIDIASAIQGTENFLAAIMLIMNDAVQGDCSCDQCIRFRETFQAFQQKEL
jgi:hypothetical protein